MKKTFVPLLLASIAFFSCKKEEYSQTSVCDIQTADPSGNSYSADQFITAGYVRKQCGLLPLNSKNFWVYEDSVFSDGVFITVQMDTLRYAPVFKSVPDNLVWWESNISAGLPELLYANDSALFEMNARMFTNDTWDARKDFCLFSGDSLKYLASFSDNAAQGRSVKLPGSLKTPAGSFSDCILFEKNARSYRKDQVYFKAGLGVIKYVHEKAPMGSRNIKLQQVMTLVSYHIE